MAIRIEHGKPETLLTAAQIAGQERAARQQLEMTERLQAQQQEFEYRATLKQQDMAIDLQMQERAKQWEIEKMQLRSQVDFQREEQQRQRKLDSYDNALSQIDKEVLAGRMTEQEAYPLKLKYEMEKMGVDTPTSLLPTDDDEKRYGVDPYWMRGRDAPEGTPERQLYEAKMAEQISGERKGTIPYHLRPDVLERVGFEIGQGILDAAGIFVDTPEEYQNLINSLQSNKEEALPEPTTKTEFDAIRKGLGTEAAPTVAGEEGGRVRVVSPNGETGSILRSEITEYRAAGFEIIGDTLKSTPETVLPSASEDVVEQLEAGEAKFYKPSLGTFATMSPLRYLMERRKAKKLVR